jgi:hypothetical protein
MMTIFNEDRHCCRRYQPPMQSTMTPIIVVNDDDWSRQFHPTVASINNNPH